MTAATKARPRAPLRLPFTRGDLAGLRWLSVRLSQWVCHVRRRRKRLPPGVPLGPDELRILSTLRAAEAAVNNLRELITHKENRNGHLE